MTLLEMSALYAESAALLRERIAELRRAAREQPDEASGRAVRRRITELEPLLAQWIAALYIAPMRQVNQKSRWLQMHQPILIHLPSIRQLFYKMHLNQKQHSNFWIT